MATEIGNGVSIETGDGFMVENAAAGGGRRRRSTLETGSDQANLDATLIAADFELAADINISPVTSRARRSAGAEALAAPQIEVALQAEERAVLLVEQQGGVFRWSWPEEYTEPTPQRRSGGASRVALFDLSPGELERPEDPEAAPRQRRGFSLGGWIADRLIEPIRVRVLRFVAEQTIDRAVDAIEGDLEEGPLVLDSESGHWQPGFPELDNERPRRVLLLVHGTFSTTPGSYGGLPDTELGRSFLRRAQQDYDAIIGFDHKTLAKTPVENADAILPFLKKLPAGTEIDAIAFSRGGLVMRAIELAAEKAGAELEFDRVVFVGCTNAGTFLANPDNWHALVDLYTTIAISSVRALSAAAGFGGVNPASFIIKTIGRFVKVLPEIAIDDGKVPGLKAMQPSGELLGQIATPASSLERYRAIQSDFRPVLDLKRGVTAEVVEFVANRVGDRFFNQANDLVVHTASMKDFGAAGELVGDDVVLLEKSTQVYHTIYFSEPAVVDAAGGFLFPENEAMAGSAGAAPPPRRRRRRSGGAVPMPQAAPDVPFPVGMPAPSGTGAPRRRRKSTEPATPEPVECHFAAQIEADPPIARPVKLGVTISPEEIELVAGQVMDRAPAPAEVDAAKPIVIEVTPLSNARLETEGRREIEVPRGTRTYWFLVEGFEPGAARIQVEASQEGRSLALLLLEPVFVEAETEQIVQTQSFAVGGGDAREPVTLRIYEIEQLGGELLVRFNLESRVPGIGETAELRGLGSRNMERFAEDFLSELNNAYDLSPEGYELKKRDLLDVAAITADQILPENIRAALWKYRDNIDAIQVIADSPTIPWELLSVTAPNGSSAGDPGRFLAEWGVMRRLPGALWPGRTLDLYGPAARFVIPDYLDDRQDLPFAQKERDMFTGKFPGAKALEADSRTVRDFLRDEAGTCSVLHFACHGSARQGSVLSTGLTLQEERGSDGKLVENLLTHGAVKLSARFSPDRPNCLVFLNACEAGRPGRHLLSDASGFADAFLRPKSRQGAAAFVGAMWEVDDELALIFARTFYDSLLGGDMLVEAARKARTAIEQKFDFTWLAYTLYGFPYARAG